LAYSPQQAPPAVPPPWRRLQVIAQPIRSRDNRRRIVIGIRRILIVDGHPDSSPERFVHALAAAYAAGARDHATRRLKLAELDFPLLRSSEEWLAGEPPPAIAAAQADIAWCEHLVLFYPLWLGDMPALLKAFLEQAMRPGFALAYRDKGFPKKLLAGRTARIVVTMGMPALFYKLFYRAHSVKSLERNILKFVGIGPVSRTIIGGVDASDERRKDWLAKMEALGAAGA
jgi:putative NADPH-quinone reductase